MLPRLWSANDAFVTFPEFENIVRAMTGELANETETQGYAQGYTAPVDVHENEDAFEFLIDVPGVSREDLKLSIENDVLRLQGERPAQAMTAENAKHFRRTERWTGSFTRSFRLPPTVDATRIEAKLTDGVLKLVLPKRDQAKPRQITING